MYVFIGALLGVLALWALPAAAKPVDVSMVAATSLGDRLPFGVLDEKPWRAEPGAEFVKVHIYPDAPIRLSKVEVESCGGSFKDDVGLFINFDEHVERMEGEAGETDAVKILAHAFETPVDARSITFNFQKNRPLCLAAIRLFDADGKRIATRTPKVVAGKASASDTLEPADSYDVMNLFDSRFEYAWSSNQKAKGVTFALSFDQPRTVRKLRLWNGYQRSDVHCWSNARIKALRVEGDGGYASEVAVADEMGGQDIALPRPFTGKSLKLIVTDYYPGKSWNNLALSELRLSDGEGWFILDPGKRLVAIAASNRQRFKAAKADEVLNRGLTGMISESNKAGTLDKTTSWSLRLRTDGSFFMDGRTTTSNYDLGEEKHDDVYALGNYTVLAARASEVKLKVFGIVRRTSRKAQIEMDCNGCGRDCNNAQASGDRSQIFHDFVTITRTAKGAQVKNVSDTPVLTFKTLDMELE
jgi:hypothetical protein